MVAAERLDVHHGSSQSISQATSQISRAEKQQQQREEEEEDKEDKEQHEQRTPSQPPVQPQPQQHQPDSHPVDHQQLIVPALKAPTSPEEEDAVLNSADSPECGDTAAASSARDVAAMASGVNTTIRPPTAPAGVHTPDIDSGAGMPATVLVDPFTGSVEVLLSPDRNTGRRNAVDVDLRSPVSLNRLPSCSSTGSTSPSMRLVPRPPDSPEALEGYLATIGATISDDVQALENVLMLGAQIPRAKQQSSADNADAHRLRYHANEASDYTPSPPSLHTHRPPRFSGVNVGGAGDVDLQTEAGVEKAESLLPSPRHLVDGVPHLLHDTDSAQTVPAMALSATAQMDDSQQAAVRCFALPAKYAQEEDYENDDISMDQNRSTHSENSDDTAIDVGRLSWASEDEGVEGSWGPGVATDSSQLEDVSIDLATATRLNQELQSQLAVHSTLLQTRRLAAQATTTSFFETTDVKMSEWDRQGVGMSQRHIDDLMAPASNGLEDAVGDLRTALATANAARRAAEATIEHMTNTGARTSTTSSGYIFGRGVAPRSTPALGRWEPGLRTTGCHASGVVYSMSFDHEHSQSQPTSLKSNENRDLTGAQLYEAVRQRWAARQETRR